MTRRRLVIVGALAAVVAVGAGGVVWTRDGKGGNSAAGASADSGTVHTGTVTRKDLAETQDVGGTLGYGDTSDISLGGSGSSGHGTVTGLAPVGTVVDRGGKLGEVDGLPVTLFFGDRPMWRTLDPTATAGADVEQLEANLIALGYGSRANLGPNQTWSDATTDAVKRWQKAVGRPQTGSVGMGDVVFLPTAVRIAAHDSGSGGASGNTGSGLKVTGTARVVAVDLDAKYQSLVKVGQAVQVELPDSSTTPGTITSVGSVATAGQNGSSPTIPVVVTLNDQNAGTGLDQAPVTVHVVTSQATGVLAVPVGALLALSEGGYAVEKVDRASATGSRLISVKLGTFADGWVQVTGSISEGDKVVTAQ